MQEMKRPDDTPISAAVLVALIERPAGPAIIFTRRTMTVATHKGQISFPGGTAEPGDTSPIDTAQREAREEIGLDPAHVQFIEYLPQVFTHTGFVVTPVLARIETAPEYALQHDEVEQVFEVPLAYLRAAGTLEIRETLFGDTAFTDYRFTTDEGVIWGMTGRILYELLERL